MHDRQDKPTSPSDELSRRYSAPALEKGLDILEILADRGRGLTMTEIAGELGRSKSEIFRHLRILADRGYIGRNGNDERYRLTNRLFEVAMRGAPVATLVGAAYPVMIETARLLEQSVHLAVISRDQMVVVARVESPGELCFSVPVGHRKMLPHAASGRVLLAFQSEGGRERLLSLLSARLATDRFDERSLRRALASIRATGCEVAESGTVHGITDISCPIFDATGEAQAALTMPFTRRRSRSDQVEEARRAMLDAASEINAALAANAWAA